MRAFRGVRDELNASMNNEERRAYEASYQKAESINSRPAKDGDEQDAFTPWRHLLCCFTRPGVSKANKQRHNRRTRRQVREQLKGERP